MKRDILKMLNYAKHQRYQPRTVPGCDEESDPRWRRDGGRWTVDGGRARWNNVQKVIRINYSCVATKLMTIRWTLSRLLYRIRNQAGTQAPSQWEAKHQARQRWAIMLNVSVYFSLLKIYVINCMQTGLKAFVFEGQKRLSAAVLSREEGEGSRQLRKRRRQLEHKLSKKRVTESRDREMADWKSLLKKMDTEAHICETCGAQHAPSANAPAECIVCADERQFVPKGGPRWAKLGDLKKTGIIHNMWQKLENRLYGITTTPKLGIGQRAFLIITPHGNLLWDCIAFLDDATIDIVKALGGLRAIAISHPHFYTSNAQWSAAFGGVPVYLHEKDKDWVTYPHENINFWSGDSLLLWEGLTVVKLGGHFAGASILHWASGGNGKGAVLSGDIVQVAMNRQGVSVMRSFPNYLPLSASKAERISKKMETLEYDRLYGAFFGLDIETNAKSLVKQSLERYVHWSQNEDLDI